MRIQASKAAAAAIMAAAALVTLLPRMAQAASGSRAGSQALDVTQLVQVALEVNPQVRAARYRWDSAEHSIKQAYAPNDLISSPTPTTIALVEPFWPAFAAGIQR